MVEWRSWIGLKGKVRPPSPPRRPKKSTWRARLAGAAVVVAIFASAPVAWVISQPSSQYGEIAIRDFARIASRTKAAGDDPASDLREARNTYYQATAVHWARVSALTTVFSTVFGLFGMLLVLATLRESRRQTRAAIDAQRAWVRIKKFNVTDLRLQANDGRVEASVGCDLAIENIGQTPAMNCDYSLVCWLVSADEASHPDTQRQFGRIILTHYADPVRGTALFPGQQITPGLNTIQYSSSRDLKHFPHNIRVDTEEYFHVFVSLIITYKISSGRECVTFETFAVYSGDVFKTSQAGARFTTNFKMSQIENVSYAD